MEPFEHIALACLGVFWYVVSLLRFTRHTSNVPIPPAVWATVAGLTLLTVAAYLVDRILVKNLKRTLLLLLIAHLVIGPGSLAVAEDSVFYAAIPQSSTGLVLIFIAIAYRNRTYPDGSVRP